MDIGKEYFHDLFPVYVVLAVTLSSYAVYAFSHPVNSKGIALTCALAYAQGHFRPNLNDFQSFLKTNVEISAYFYMNVVLWILKTAASALKSFLWHSVSQDDRSHRRLIDFEPTVLRSVLGERMHLSIALPHAAKCTLDQAVQNAFTSLNHLINLQPTDTLLELDSGWSFFLHNAYASLLIHDCLGATASIHANKYHALTHKISPYGPRIIGKTWQTTLACLPSCSVDKLVHVSLLTATLGLKNLGAYARAVARCLRPGGRFVFHVCSLAHWDCETVGWYLFQHAFVLAGSDGVGVGVNTYLAEFQAQGLVVDMVENTSDALLWSMGTWHGHWIRNQSDVDDSM